MRAKVLLLSALLHGAGITCAVVAVGAGAGESRPTPYVAWSPSQDLPFLPPPPPLREPVHHEEPGGAAIELAPEPVEPLDPEAFAPAREPPPQRRREVLPVPDVRVRLPAEPEPAREPPAAEPAPEPEPPASEAAYVQARVLVAENDPPRYPRRARRMGHEGEVWVEVIVGTDGRAERVSLAKACRHPELNREALRAVREWRFSPARRSGRPEQAIILVPVEFRLR